MGSMALRVVLAALLAAFLSAGAPPRVSAAGEPAYKRSVHRYEPPDVVLVNQDGRKVKFRELVDSGGPVFLDFIYGTCTTICPIMSAGFSSFQAKLGPDGRKVRLVSISIDPEHDTPKILREYLRTYRAKPGWDFLTGSRRDIDRVMRAFDAYVPDKMYHKQVTFLRTPGSGGWVRIDGLMGSAELVAEYGKAGWR